MKNSLLKISGVSSINKNTQKSINGGLVLSDCPTGCQSEFLFCPLGPNTCLVPSRSGALCHGTLQNQGFQQVCCL